MRMVQDEDMATPHNFGAPYIAPSHQSLPIPPPPVNGPGDSEVEVDRFRAQFHKTELCRFFKKGCRNGDACAYAHGSGQLTMRPDLKKTSLCKNWEQGKCNLTGAECIFAHGRNEIKTTPMFDKKPREKEQSFDTGRLEWQNEQIPTMARCKGKQGPDVQQSTFGARKKSTGKGAPRASTAVTMEPRPWMTPQDSGQVSGNSFAWSRGPNNPTAQQLQDQNAATYNFQGMQNIQRVPGPRTLAQPEQFSSVGVNTYAGGKGTSSCGFSVGTSGFGGLQPSREMTVLPNHGQMREQLLPRPMLGKGDFPEMDPYNEADIVDLDAYRSSKARNSRFQSDLPTRQESVDTDGRGHVRPRSNNAMCPTSAALVSVPSLPMQPQPQVVDIPVSMVEGLLMQAAPEYYDD